MSSRRLVQRGRIDENNSSPAQRPRQRESTTAHEPAPLPPYEPPNCALTPNAKRALDNLRVAHDYSQYKRHIDGSIKALTNSVGDSNERLRLRKEALDKAKERRARAGDVEEGKTEQQTQYEGAKRNVATLTLNAEQALRDLIDYGDELAMKDTIMIEVSENVAAAPTARPATRGQRRHESNQQNGENEEPIVEEDEDAVENGYIVSAVELLKKAQEHYAAEYAARSMRARYDTNEYRSFKSTVHIATVGPNGPPVPHTRTWFPEDNQNSCSGRDTNNEESDDEVVIASATLNMKCPLTLQVFKEPFVNEKCNHVFEKSAIVEHIQNNGTIFAQSSQRRGQRGGHMQVKCPQVGCDNMLKLDDFRIDDVLLRQIKQAETQAARDLEDDDDDEPALRGTQRSRPADIDDEDGEDNSIDVEVDRRATIARIKRERQQSRDASTIPGRQNSSGIGEEETEVMDED